MFNQSFSTPRRPVRLHIDKSYLGGGFELRWREGPLHRFVGVTGSDRYEGHQNDAVHFDDGCGTWPFPDPPIDPVPNRDHVERFGELNAWLLAWWPWLCAKGIAPEAGILMDLDVLAGP